MKKLCLALALMVGIGFIAAAFLPSPTIGAEGIVLTESGTYLYGLPERTSLKDFKNIYGRSGFSVLDASGKPIAESAVIGTGYKVRYEGGDVGSTIELEVIIAGDVDGNGKVTTTDYISIKNHLVKGNLKDAKAVAADVDGYGVSSSDYLKVKLHFEGRYDLYSGIVVPEESKDDSSSEGEYNESNWTSGWS